MLRKLDKSTRMNIRWLRVGRLLLWGVLGTVLAIVLIYVWVELSTAKQVYVSTDEVPARQVGVVLGTTPYVATGRENQYFTHRMDAAAALFHAGKVQHLLVSGDNRFENYNEPSAMHKALVARGVPDSAITLDYAGFRTLDSIVRTQKVFGLSSIMIITQDFHNRRALFIANRKDIDAIGLNAIDVSLQTHPTIYLREALARVKAVLDLYILQTKARFEGPAEPIVLD